MKKVFVVDFCSVGIDHIFTSYKEALSYVVKDWEQSDLTDEEKLIELTQLLREGFIDDCVYIYEVPMD